MELAHHGALREVPLRVVRQPPDLPRGPHAEARHHPHLLLNHGGGASQFKKGDR